jgi:hypothetical protein
MLICKAIVMSLLNSIQGNSIVRNVKNFLTTSILRPHTAPDTVAKALKFQEQGKKLASPKANDQDTRIQKLTHKVKYGHFVGVGLGFLTAFIKPLIEKYNWDDSVSQFIKRHLPLAVISSLGSFGIATFLPNPNELASQGDLDSLVQRFEVDSTGKSVDLKEDASSTDFPSLDDVILSESNKEELDSGLGIVKEKDRGGVFCLRGITRCGKTMTSKALARHLAQETGNKAQYWYASEDTMTGSIADKEKLFGDMFGVETTIKKIERLLARAIVESNKGETPIVIVLDEAHKMLGGNSSRPGKYDVNNPHHTNSVVESLKRLFSETVNTKMCKGIYVVMTANSSANEIAAPMRERMVADLFYDKPHEIERYRFIEHILQREMEEKTDKLDIKVNDITEQDIQHLSEIGTCNLLKQFGSNNEDRAFEEAVRAGFGGNVEELRNRPMLTHETIEKIIVSKVAHYANGKVAGGKQVLLRSIEEALNAKVQGILDQKSAWRSELLHYFGSNDSERSIFPAVKLA